MIREIKIEDLKEHETKLEKRREKFQDDDIYDNKSPQIK